MRGNKIESNWIKFYVIEFLGMVVNVIMWLTGDDITIPGVGVSVGVGVR